MGRNMLEALINEARLQDLGVRVLYVEEDFDDTAAGRFAARSMMNVNQFYSENMAEDIKRGLYDNAANCMVANGHLPYGYKADETLHYAIDEPKAAVIREIFTRVSCGEAFVDIMASLNARGIKTSYGRPWGGRAFRRSFPTNGIAASIFTAMSAKRAASRGLSATSFTSRSRR